MGKRNGVLNMSNRFKKKYDEPIKLSLKAISFLTTLRRGLYPTSFLGMNELCEKELITKTLIPYWVYDGEGNKISGPHYYIPHFELTTLGRNCLIRKDKGIFK